jgi:hypothetical protein
MLARDKGTSLFRLSVSDEEKQFYNFDCRCQLHTNILSVVMLRDNKLECLYLPIVFSLILYLHASL